MKKIANWIANHSKLILIISLLLTIPSIIGFITTRINYDVLVYLPNNIETIKGQDILTNDFGIGAYAFILSDKENPKELKQLEEKLKTVNTVNEVISINDITNGSIPLEMLPDDIKEKLKSNKSTLIMVTLSDSTSSDVTLSAIEDIRKIVGDANQVSSMSAMVLDTRDLSNKEIVAYVIIAVLFVILILTFATDSYVTPLLLLSNIGLAILYNMGSNIIFGEISYITKAISAVLQLGVTMDFSIFLYDKYRYLKSKGKKPTDAMSEAIQETFNSVTGSSLTTIAGFLSLCGMSLTLGKDIGLVMAKGVLMGLISVLTILPSLLIIFDKVIEKTNHKIIFPQFKLLQTIATKHYKVITIIAIILLIPFIYGNHNVNVYYKLDESLPSDLPSQVSNKSIKEQYNIASPEFILINKDLKGNKLDELSKELENLEGIDMVLTPGKIESLGIPDSFIPDKLKKVYKTDKYQLIIVNSTYDVASDELNNQIDKVNEIIKKYDENSILAGEGALTKDLIKISNHDFNVVNYVSIAVIFIIMLFVLKSASLPFILVLVIEMAIFGNMSWAFFTGDKLPFISSIVVGTIQLGATIDYAILMSNTYLNNRRKGKDKNEAIKNTLGAVTPSIIMSALCFFAATFGVYVYSDIDMIGSICELLSRGAIISMVTVILLLPALLRIFDKLIIKTTKNMEGVN
ncbi:MAG: MMPL family transporter [Bacilli bacterium]|nr:MMPL family transporter [Bacilli bacterium]